MFYNSNLTIAFSGYNIKTMATLAIDSLLKIYPNMKTQIVYFDDFSTDGTREELKARGIKVITWDKDLLSQYNQCVQKNPNWNNVQTLSVRVSFIIENIVRQTNTEYLLLNDGDVLFRRKGCLERFMEQAEDYDIIYQNTGAPQVKPFQESIVKAINARYAKKVFETKNNYYYWRMAHSHIFLNARKLKEAHITSDSLDADTVSYIEGGLFDTFTDFSNRAVESADLRVKEENTIGENIIHFGSFSCEQRGFENGLTIETAGDGGCTINGHIHREHQGQDVDGSPVILDYNRCFDDISRDLKTIEHILSNGYAVKDIYRNKNIYKITFKKIQ